MKAALHYIAKMLSEYFNSLGLENTFNDLRDNHMRGAKHCTRNESTIQSQVLSSMATRHAEERARQEEEGSGCATQSCTTYQADAPTGRGLAFSEYSQKGSVGSVQPFLCLQPQVSFTRCLALWSSNQSM